MSVCMYSYVCADISSALPYEPCNLEGGLSKSNSPNAAYFCPTATQFGDQIGMGKKGNKERI